MTALKVHWADAQSPQNELKIEWMPFLSFHRSITYQLQSHKTDFILWAGGLKAWKVFWSMISIWPF